MALNLLEWKFLVQKSALERCLKKQLHSIYSKRSRELPVSLSILLAWNIDTHYELYRIGGIDTFCIVSPNTTQNKNFKCM